MVVDGDWMDRAACRGLHDINWDGPMAWPDAIEVCGGCPVRVSCLRAALSKPREHDYGILAGSTAHERDLMRQRKLDPRRLWAEQGYPHLEEAAHGR